jgi:hypothetical protein
MPRLNYRSPSYRKHVASGQAVVTIGGRDIYLGPYGTKTSKAEYDRVVAEWLVSGRHSSGPTAGPRDLTVAEVVDRFWIHAQAYYRHADGTPTSEVECLKHPLKILNRLFGHTLAREFGPLALEAVRNAMVGAGWRRRSINNQIIRVRHVFKWAVSKELVPPFVHHGLSSLSSPIAFRTASIAGATAPSFGSR